MHKLQEASVTEIVAIRHAWPEDKNFIINRPAGVETYTFLHFFGSVRIKISNNIVETRPGACIFYSPGTPQRYQSEAPLVHNWAHVDRSLKYRLQQYALEENRIYYPENGGFITEIFKEIENEWLSSRRFRQECMESLFNEFLIKFSRSVSGDRPPDTDESEAEMYSKIRESILMQLDRRWTVEQMAQLAWVSPSRFHSRYRRFFGTTPINDLILARIGAAKERLLSSDLPVHVIASELGYTNQYHFIRQFGSVVGCPPAEYRRRNFR